MIDGLDDLRNPNGERLDAVHTAAAPGVSSPAGPGALVVVAHGVTSHHDRPWLVALCDALSAAGVASVRFSFAGNGRSEGRFVDATISKEVDDLGAVLDLLVDRAGRRVAYAGHSMGGAVGTLRAADDDRVAAFLSLAGMVHVTRFVDRHFGDLVPGRDVMLGKPDCPLSRAFVDDARRIGDVLDAARRVRCPWRIVHGTADEIVPFADAEAAVEASGGRAE
ncbi:MAG: alpha/beta hydrolase family protein, partial [Planctomycetota bacterium JB042]